MCFLQELLEAARLIVYAAIAGIGVLILIGHLIT